MFLQLILAQAGDIAGLRRQCDQWRREVAHSAEGALGSTAGITPDGRFVLTTRFQSPEAAASSSRRAERRAWWAATEECLAGPATVLETTDVTVVHENDPAAAGFVQVMRGRARDRARFEAIEAEIGPAFLALRPDALASYVAWFPDGTFAVTDYFSSEAEARAGESAEMPKR